MKLLLGKYNQKEYGAIYCKNLIHYVRLEKRLYDDYFLTSIGIFKFQPMGYYRSMKMYSCDVVLPRQSFTSVEGMN